MSGCCSSTSKAGCWAAPAMSELGMLPGTVLPETPWQGRLAVIGIGLEGRGGMSPRGRRLLETAEVVVGSARQLALAAVAAEQLEVPWSGKLDDLLPRLAGLRGETTVLLASGDPNIYGVGAT